MPLYARKARDQYNKDHNKQKFITTVWDAINNHSRESQIAEKAAKTILSLTKSNGNNSWITGKQILAAAGIKNYKWNRSYGLWPWLEKIGAGVIEEQGQWPNTSYRVKDEFYQTMDMVIMGWSKLQRK